MDMRSYLDLELKRGKDNERVYHFLLPVGAPYGEAYDAAFECLTKITELAKQAAEQAAPKESEQVASAESAQ